MTIYVKASLALHVVTELLLAAFILKKDLKCLRSLTMTTVSIAMSALYCVTLQTVGWVAELLRSML